MARHFLNFGSGSDGDLVISSNTTDSPTDASCSGASGSNSLSATNASFATGQVILIHQSRGTGFGNWELNKIASYVAGTITTSFELENTYTDSGASQAQVIVMKEYSSIDVQSGKTLSAKAWNGDVGGILAYLCSGTLTIAGGISANGQGYKGGAGKGAGTGKGNCGEGTAGASQQISTANGNGGGGGSATSSGDAGGGGGGHAGAGSAGTKTGSGTGGSGGEVVGSADLTTMVFGGGGGGGQSDDTTSGAGGDGGGIIFITASIIAEITGSITVSGANGVASGQAGGGAGAGGAVLLKGQIISMGTSKISSSGATGGNTIGADGGNSGVGRIRAEACSLSGATNPGASEEEGGQNWCGTLVSMIES